MIFMKKNEKLAINFKSAIAII